MKTYSNLQEVFDTAVAGLASQDFKPSVNKEGNCRYRGSGGRRCAIGWCIPNKLYNSGMEGVGVFGVIDDSKGINNLFSKVDTYKLARLQYCHDIASHVGGPFVIKSVMIDELRKFAKQNKLRMPKVLHLKTLESEQA